jgi:hypothetical protein
MIELCIWYPTAWGQWLSQANHIFRHLRITSNLEEYGASSSCGSCHVFADLFYQWSCVIYSSGSRFQELRRSLLPVSYFSARRTTSKLVHSLLGGQTVLPTGLLIHPVVIGSLSKRQQGSDSLSFSVLPNSGGNLGRLVSTRDYGNSTWPKDSMQILRTLPGI